ncbi:hypothetical protein BDZ94DRAFT_1172538 [Collybia nuda]|uniref:FAD dependent oxidoreductase domain-containing protein n=1 Tax=Collybia nuda TaxID=64659 RepID=A0A9P6CE97_9AGAR|nr:hypothetical protein BDZ94DRAFT_1172538 [Collybia nuda]
MTSNTRTHTTQHPHPILVCGFGIIGLTTSIRLLQAGHSVIAVASHLPSDPLSPYYASTAAGAHHLSFAADGDERQRRLDRRTFDVMWEEEEEEGDGSGLMRVTQREFYGSEGERHVQFFEGLPDFKVYETNELPPFAKHAVSFTSLTMDPPAYLSKLVSLFTALGGVIHRATLPSLASALQFAPSARAIINCTALGSRTLTDVNDMEMYPVRGQVVVLRAPWIREGRTKQVGSLEGGEGGERTYIIPRRSGEVVIGGTREVDDWCSCVLCCVFRTPDPRPETSQDIKQRALAIFPELVPPDARVAGQTPQPEDLDEIVVRDVVGLRPARRGGLRLERGDDLVLGVPIIHNVGHSGAGWQSCWGCAEEVVRLVEVL